MKASWADLLQPIRVQTKLSWVYRLPRAAHKTLAQSSPFRLATSPHTDPAFEIDLGLISPTQGSRSPPPMVIIPSAAAALFAAISSLSPSSRSRPLSLFPPFRRSPTSRRWTTPASSSSSSATAAPVSRWLCF